MEGSGRVLTAMMRPAQDGAALGEHGRKGHPALCRQDGQSAVSTGGEGHSRALQTALQPSADTRGKVLLESPLPG